MYVDICVNRYINICFFTQGIATHHGATHRQVSPEQRLVTLYGTTAILGGPRLGDGCHGRLIFLQEMEKNGRWWSWMKHRKKILCWFFQDWIDVFFSGIFEKCISRWNHRVNVTFRAEFHLEMWCDFGEASWPKWKEFHETKHRQPLWRLEDRLILRQKRGYLSIVTTGWVRFCFFFQRSARWVANVVKCCRTWAATCLNTCEGVEDWDESCSFNIENDVFFFQYLVWRAGCFEYKEGRLDDRENMYFSIFNMCTGHRCDV